MYYFIINQFLKQKFLVKMTRTSLFCMMFLILAMNCMAIDAYSQTVRLSINVSKPNLKDVVVEIKKKTEFDFLYSKDVESLYRASEYVKIEDGTIDDVLNQLFKNSQIAYHIIEKTIVSLLYCYANYIFDNKQFTNIYKFTNKNLIIKIINMYISIKQ